MKVNVNLSFTHRVHQNFDVNKIIAAYLKLLKIDKMIFLIIFAILNNYVKYLLLT